MVIARYNEDISWIRSSTIKDIPKVIYNKGIHSDDFNYIRLNNVGREAHTFFHYIIENYDNLDDVTIFLPGSCMDEGKIKN